MSKPNASFVRSNKARFFTSFAAAVVGATALLLSTPLPAAADDRGRGRWEQNDKKGKHENHDRRGGKGHDKGKREWQGNRDRGHDRGGWNGGHDRGKKWNGGHQGGGHENRHHYRGGGGGGHHYNGGSKHHYHEKRHHHVKHHYHHYSQPVYVPYASAYFCNPCAHYFGSYDDLYAHAAYAHYVPEYDLPNLVVQVGVNWVFGF